MKYNNKNEDKKKNGPFTLIRKNTENAHPYLISQGYFYYRGVIEERLTEELEKLRKEGLEVIAGKIIIDPFNQEIRKSKPIFRKISKNHIN